MQFTKFLAVAAAAVSGQAAVAQGVGEGGKLLLTNGVSTIEGASGGGLSTWALIAGNETRDGIGGSAHVTLVETRDYGWRSYGAAIGFFDRVELSYVRQDLDTREIGAALGIGRGYTLNQDVFGAKLRVAGDAVYGDAWMPQIAVGVQHKRAADGAIARAVGARETKGTDFYLSATKLLLSHSVLVGGTLRLTKANQNGLLGFGGDQEGGRSLQVEGAVGYQFSRRFVAGAEYRTKPDNLGIAREDDWWDVYAAYAVARNLTVSAAYVDLGSIATAQGQRGGFLQLQASF